MEEKKIINDFSKKNGSADCIPTTNYVNDGLKETGLIISNIMGEQLKEIKEQIKKEKEQEKIKKYNDLKKQIDSSDKGNKNITKRKSIL